MLRILTQKFGLTIDEIGKHTLYQLKELYFTPIKEDDEIDGEEFYKNFKDKQNSFIKEQQLKGKTLEESKLLFEESLQEKQTRKPREDNLDNLDTL